MRLRSGFTKQCGMVVLAVFVSGACSGAGGDLAKGDKIDHDAASSSKDGGQVSGSAGGAGSKAAGTGGMNVPGQGDAALTMLDDANTAGPDRDTRIDTDSG